MQTFDARGRDLLTGLPKTITISAPEIAEALQDQVEGILGAIKDLSKKYPTGTSGHIMDRGIVMAGGVPSFSVWMDWSVRKRGCPSISLKIP